MTRMPFDADDRAGLIAELTQQRLRAWSRDLQASVQRAIDDVRKAVLPQLTPAEARIIFIQAVTDLAGAEHRFNVLAAKAVYVAAESEATRIVDAMEQARGRPGAGVAHPAGAATGSAA